jgi:hypothetical protein
MGMQAGREGLSYAIKTIEHPGQKRSTPLREIFVQLDVLARTAIINPQFTFYMTPVGAGLAGWTNEEMLRVWNNIKGDMPENVIYPQDLYEKVKILDT